MNLKLLLSPFGIVSHNNIYIFKTFSTVMSRDLVMWRNSPNYTRRRGGNTMRGIFYRSIQKRNFPIHSVKQLLSRSIMSTCLLCPMTDMAGWHTIDYAQRESQQRLPAYVLEETVSFLMQLHTHTHTHIYDSPVDINAMKQLARNKYSTPVNPLFAISILNIER